ncbi:hypothetical protein ACQZV8_13830 [Magnetococcales bacterium HHB-1]
MDHQQDVYHLQPLFRNRTLILSGGLLIMLVTTVGLLSDSSQILQQDALYGPLIAASKIFLPLFFTLGLVYFLSGVKKCAICGKIFLWRKNRQHQDDLH